MLHTDFLQTLLHRVMNLILIIDFDFALIYCRFQINKLSRVRLQNLPIVTHLGYRGEQCSSWTIPLQKSCFLPPDSIHIHINKYGDVELFIFQSPIAEYVWSFQISAVPNREWPQAYSFADLSCPYSRIIISKTVLIKKIETLSDFPSFQLYIFM